MATVHIESKKEDIANIVLMPGDPKRAKYIADKYLTNVKLVNEVRGMTAYTGYYKNKRITVFPSGMGNPSMGIYSYELFNEYDVDYIIRIGSAGAYLKELDLYNIVLATKSYTESTFAKVQNGETRDVLESSTKLNDIIRKTALELSINIKEGTVHSSDVFYHENMSYMNEVINHACLACEMESFALFHNANLFGKNATCLLTISDNLVTKSETTSEEREKSFNQMMELALESILKINE